MWETCAARGLAPPKGSDTRWRARALAACRVDVTGRSGPDHAPRFMAEGVARFPDGSEARTAPLEGASKREAIGAAACALIAILRGSLT